MTENWNEKIIAEFRGNEGQVGGVFEGKPLLLLHSTGARTGHERVNPLMYQRQGEEIAVFASAGGAPSHPDWFYNIGANPGVRVELGTENFSAVARVAESEERERIWTQQKLDFPQFAGYEAGTDREIPVILLARAS